MHSDRNAEASGVERKPSQVGECLNTLAAKLDALDMASQELEARLGSVLRNEPTDNSPISKDDRDGRVSLASVIHGHGERVERITTLVRGIISRLEL